MLCSFRFELPLNFFVHTWITNCITRTVIPARNSLQLRNIYTKIGKRFESTMSAVEDPKLDPKIVDLMKRFIHVGMEKPKYYPGCWTTHKYFQLGKFAALEKAFEGGTNSCLEAIKLIVKISKEDMYTRFETIPFALTKCLVLTNQYVVKEAVYNAVNEVCTTSEKFLLFNKYTRLLKTGNGTGWCRSTKSWYLSKDPMELAKEVTRVCTRHGRSHKTLLRKSHIKAPDGDHAREAVFKYVINGLKRARALCGANEGTKEVLDYIQKADDMKHCEDPAVAAAIASANQFNLDYVPGHLLTSQEVWDAILPQMELRDILHNLQRIHNMGFLTAQSTTTAILMSIMNNQDIVDKSEVTPIEVYITLKNYKNKSRPISHTKAKILAEKEKRRRARQIFDPKTGLWEWSTTKRHPTEIKNWGIEKPPNEAIMASLNKLFDQAWFTTKPTNVRYLITMDMRHHMFKGRHFCKQYKIPKKVKPAKKPKPGQTVVEIIPKPAPPAPAVTAAGDGEPEKTSKKRLLAQCFYNSDVTPGHAAIIMALQILKREKNAKLAVFTEEGIQLVVLEHNFINIDEAEFKLRSLNLGRVQLDAPIEWAAKNKQEFDVFINIVDRTTRFLELEREARGGRGNAGRYGAPPVPGKKGVVLPDRCPVRALHRYRTTTDMHDAKLIVMSLASHRVETTDGTHAGVLDVVGIDKYVPKVIDAFTLGHFK